MKPIGMLAATAVLGIAIGYGLGRGGSSEGKSSAGKDVSAESTASRQRDRTRPERSASSSDDALSSLLKGRSIQSLSARDIADLFEQQNTRDRNEDPVATARRNYQIQLLLSKLPKEMLAELSQEMLTSDGKRSNQGYTVFNAWARRDWKEALQWAESDPKGSQWVGAAISALALTDPGMAEDMLKERMLSGEISDGRGYNAMYTVAQAKARLGKDAFLQFIEGLPAQQQSNMISSAARDLPEGDLVAFLDELYQRKAGKNMNSWSYNNVLNELMRVDPAKAEAWIDKMEPGTERNNIEVGMVSNLASSGKMSESIEMMTKLVERDPAKAKDSIKQLVNQMSYQGPVAMAEIISALPKDIEMTAADFQNNIHMFGYGRASSLVDMAKTIRNPDEQAKLLTQAMDQAAQQMNSGGGGGGRFNDTDLRIFENRLATLNLTGTANESVSASLAKVREAVANPPAKQQQ